MISYVFEIFLTVIKIVIIISYFPSLVFNIHSLPCIPGNAIITALLDEVTVANVDYLIKRGLQLYTKYDFQCIQKKFPRYYLASSQSSNNPLSFARPIQNFLSVFVHPFNILFIR